MTTDWREQRLPCGRDLGGVVDQAAGGRAGERDAHQRTCPYCRAALDEAGRSWGPVRELAAQPVDPPPGLVDAILRRVHRLAQEGWVTLSHTARGLTRVSSWVVALVAETAAEATPGVHRVGGGFGHLADRLRGGGRSADSAEVVKMADQVVEIDIDVVAEYGTPLPEIAAAIRRNVRREVTTITGLEVAGVDIAVTDLRVPPA